MFQTLTRFLFLTTMVTLMTPAALADCTTPQTGVSGQVNYWGSPSRPYFCDGTHWYQMNFSDQQGACSTAGTFTRHAGKIHFCNGDNWMAQSSQAIVLGSCSTEGEFSFDTTSGVMALCDNGVRRTVKLPGPATTYNATGGVQTYTPPPGVRRITARIWGAGGGGGGGSRKGTSGTLYKGGVGGGGAYTVVQFEVTEGEQIDVYVGRGGAGGLTDENTALLGLIPAGTFTGGGGGGGGLTQLFRKDANMMLVRVGAGGGGGGADENSTSGNGGAGGISDGSPGGVVSGTSSSPGGGGTSTSGGSAGSGNSGTMATAGGAGLGGNGGGKTGTLPASAYLNGGRGGPLTTNLLPGGGGGGAGFMGGGGGGGTDDTSDVGAAGGGGGSSGVAAGATFIYTNPGTGSTPGGFGIADRPLSIAVGGDGGNGTAAGTAGGDGLIILIPDPVP